jgi:RNA polymerase sigma-70 factor (ECF subfamily)
LVTRPQNNDANRSAADERAIFERVVNGERDGLADLYRLYYPRLFRFTYRLTNSFGAAEELVNDVMLAVWEGAASFRHQSKISTWVYGIAYRKCMSHLRRKRITTVPDVSVEHLADEAGENIDDAQWVRQGLDSLPVEQRLCMLLVFYVGCSYAEVAEITDCKAETVKTRMFYARQKLRATMPEMARPVS